MTPALFLLLSLLHLRDPAPAEVARVEAFAAAVSRAVDAAPALPFTGPGARLGTIAALLVIAHHESGLRAEVVDCRVTGDRGASLTAFQLMAPWALGGHSRAEVCASVEVAAGQALAVLVVHARRCSRSAPLAWFRGYAAGSCGTPSKAAADMCATWERAAARVGVVGAACGARRALTVQP